MAAKEKPSRPLVDIPLTPNSTTSSNAQSSTTPTASSFSVLASATALPGGADPLSAIGKQKPAILPDIEAVALLMRKLKEMNQQMKGMYESIETHTERAATLGPVIKAGEEIAMLKSNLEKQIIEHDAELTSVRKELDTRVKERLESRLRQYVTDEIRASVARKIENKVRQELEKQIPQDLRKQTNEHTRQMMEIKTHLHNSDARRINATLTRKEKLRPLIPSNGSTSPSPLFPNNIDACLAMSAKDVKQLVKDYELDKASPVSPAGTSSKAENVNKFLDYIGAPYHVLLIPTPAKASPKVGFILVTRKPVI
ncbi:uncharacterized protein EV420DRAFT_1553625 [Desarmillaria tabescens]|uniref:Uncharacterized protein n=1 Tax=Armillaria tabescens TaxID=1929756 RepID=A0AA39K6Y5_ARMTA|nr:uncharacterized protein EV420DRAFT_1553625 [Desarmillaria tabescens]KAK0455438.1 hypothetical protein EV420DRAFT_1553625 [Desarmillaria tabescens]